MTPTPIEVIEQAWEKDLATHLEVPSDERLLELLRRASCGKQSLSVVTDSIAELRRQIEFQTFLSWEQGWDRLLRNIQKRRDTWTLEKYGRVGRAA